MSDMIYLVLLGLLIVAVAVIVWRGSSNRPDSDSNKRDIGGGSGDGGF